MKIDIAPRKKMDSLSRNEGLREKQKQRKSGGGDCMQWIKLKREKIVE